MLHFAIRNNNVEIIKELLKTYGLNLNSQNSIGEFPLMMATKSKNLDLIHLLCEYDIDINQVDNDGQTCLLYAIENGLNEIATFYISHQGTNINKGNEQGMTPLMVAIKNNSIEICLAILSHPDIDIYFKDNEGISTY